MKSFATSTSFKKNDVDVACDSVSAQPVPIPTVNTVPVNGNNEMKNYCLTVKKGYDWCAALLHTLCQHCHNVDVNTVALSDSKVLAVEALRAHSSPIVIHFLLSKRSNN